MNTDIEPLENVLGVKFRDDKLLSLALTHPSMTHEDLRPNIESNQRLEFLGDAFIGLVIAHEIYIHYPSLPEGELTELRSSVVRREALERVGNALGLGSYFRFYVYPVFGYASFFYMILYVISPLYTWRISPEIAAIETRQHPVASS